MDNQTMLQAALNYISEGFRVFPVKMDKKPYTKHGSKDATQTKGGVKEYWTRFPDASIAVVTDGFIALDFDVKNGGLESKAAIINKFGFLPRTRVHKTGGGGEHWIYRNPDGRKVGNTVKLGGYDGVDLRADGGYIIVPPSSHISGTKYELLDDAPITSAPDWLMELAKNKKAAPAAAMPEGEPIPKGKRNATLASQGGSMRQRGMPEAAIAAALLEVNRLQCQPPLLEDDVRQVARSVSRYAPNNGNNTYVHIRTQQDQAEAKRNKNATENATGEREGNGKTQQEPLAKRIEDWVTSTSGWFDTPELDRDLGITSISDKNNRREIMLRLESKGIVERHPKISKQFRYINTKVTHLAFKTANVTGVLPVKWPLGIERYVNLFPRNMAVVAGSPNSGKTALLLNFIYLNQDNFPIYYLCSEMGAVELRDRLDKFPGMAIADWEFEAIERVSDFADVIKPDCVNIIDYLEMTTELYTVNTHLVAIGHRLGSGLAVVALQKKVGATYGRGQEFGLEKPKLYLSMDDGKLQIVKGKSWATSKVNPNGLSIKFKIIDGCQFQATSEWDLIK